MEEEKSLSSSILSVSEVFSGANTNSTSTSSDANIVGDGSINHSSNCLQEQEEENSLSSIPLALEILSSTNANITSTSNDANVVGDGNINHSSNCLQEQSANNNDISGTGGSGGSKYKYFKCQSFEPDNNDVIIGRGKKCYNHQGNEKLRNLVHSRVKAYSLSNTKSEKSRILCGIITSIRNDGGGFMKLDAEEKLYYDVGDIIAKEKISQTFRDCLQDTYKSSVMYKKKRRQEQNAEILAFKRARAKAVAAAGAAGIHKRRKMNYNNNNMSNLAATLSELTGNITSNGNNGAVGQSSSSFPVRNDIPTFIFQQQQQQFQHHKYQNVNCSVLSPSLFDKIETGERRNERKQRMSTNFLQNLCGAYNNDNNSNKNIVNESGDRQELDLSNIDQNGGGGGYYDWLVSDLDDDDDNFEDDAELWGNRNIDNSINKESSNNNKNNDVITNNNLFLDEQLEEIDLFGLEEENGEEISSNTINNNYNNSNNNNSWLNTTSDYLKQQQDNNNDNKIMKSSSLSIENMLLSSSKEKCLSSNVMGRHQLVAVVAATKKKRTMMRAKKINNNHTESNTTTNNKSRTLSARMA